MAEETECPSCGLGPLESRKTVEDNEVHEEGWYCPDCENEYGEDVTLSWDAIDFPVWIEWESYEDNWGMWRNFLRQTNLHGDARPSGYGDMKYTVFYVWFKVTEDGSVEGPFDEKRGELMHE